MTLFLGLAQIPAVLGCATVSPQHPYNELRTFCLRRFAFGIARHEVRHGLHGISANIRAKIKVWPSKMHTKSLEYIKNNIKNLFVTMHFSEENQKL